jgi:hypothetical protein
MKTGTECFLSPPPPGITQATAERLGLSWQGHVNAEAGQAIRGSRVLHAVLDTIQCLVVSIADYAELPCPYEDTVESGRNSAPHSSGSHSSESQDAHRRPGLRRSSTAPRSPASAATGGSNTGRNSTESSNAGLPDVSDRFNSWNFPAWDDYSGDDGSNIEVRRARNECRPTIVRIMAVLRSVFELRQDTVSLVRALRLARAYLFTFHGLFFGRASDDARDFQDDQDRPDRPDQEPTKVDVISVGQNAGQDMGQGGGGDGAISGDDDDSSTVTEDSEDDEDTTGDSDDGDDGLNGTHGSSNSRSDGGGGGGGRGCTYRDHDNTAVSTETIEEWSRIGLTYMTSDSPALRKEASALILQLRQSTVHLTPDTRVVDTSVAAPRGGSGGGGGGVIRIDPCTYSRCDYGL